MWDSIPIQNVAYSEQKEGPRQILPYTPRCTVNSKRVKGCTIPILVPEHFWMHEIDL
jgi:hypothetical protein